MILKVLLHCKRKKNSVSSEIKKKDINKTKVIKCNKKRRYRVLDKKKRFILNIKKAIIQCNGKYTLKINVFIKKL